MTLSIAWWGERAFAPPFRAQASAIERKVEVGPGDRVELGRVEGAGIVRRLWLHVDGWPWSPSPSAGESARLADLLLRIRWDGEEEPSVSSPVAAFFASGHGVRRHFASEYLVSSSTGLHSYFPMPYRDGFRLEIENAGRGRAPRAIACEIGYQPASRIPGGLGRFCATYREGVASGRAGAPILEAEGPGQFVGMTLALEGDACDRESFLAAREALSILRSGGCPPQEIRDYFEGIEGRNGEFAGPLRGVPYKDPEGSCLSMYRFHPEDRIRFQTAVSLSYLRTRSNGAALAPFRYRSVAFWYRMPRAK